MAFLRVEKKKSGTYLRIVKSYKKEGVSKHKTLHSLGKVEDYPADQLERIASKLLELAGCSLEDILGDGLEELGRYNYGYALIIKKLWKVLSLDKWLRTIKNKSRIRFDWLSVLELMLAARLNEPCSKRSNFINQDDYIGFGTEKKELQHFYRTLDLLSEHQESLKKHLFQSQQNLFSSTLDLVFYDVTSLYFESDLEQQDALRQKGYSKDGKAHKTQIVLGLLVDKMRNPISYHIYKGNTYEGKTMKDALESLQKDFNIDQVVVVADSAMINKNNRELLEGNEKLSYILGDRIKNLPKKISDELINRKNHRMVKPNSPGLTYHVVEHQGRKIICTYSEKRARKDQHSRAKQIAKAEALLSNPAQLKQSKKRGAGRYICQVEEEQYQLDVEKIEQDQKWDGFKAISTTTQLSVEQCISKYSDLFEVEHAFRTLKSQIKVRPIFHWTNKRIEGHIAMCFMAYTFLNYLRNTTQLQHKAIIKALDQMQLSEINEKATQTPFYMRSKIKENQATIIQKLKLVVPRDTTSQSSVNQYFI